MDPQELPIPKQGLLLTHFMVIRRARFSIFAWQTSRMSTRSGQPGAPIFLRNPRTMASRSERTSAIRMVT
jgi:hypothetical protein